MPERTTLVLGGVEAEVSLTKTCAKPTEAKHETRRVSVTEPSVSGGDPQEKFYRNLLGGMPASATAVEVSTPFDATDDPADHGDPFGGPLDMVGGPEPDDPAPDDPEPAPETKVQQGATNEAGEWIDLTERLEAIDEDCKIEGMALDCVVAQSAVQAFRVRESHYVAPAEPGAAKVLGHVWAGLRDVGGAALMRRTKRTNQALGALVARGTKQRPYLVLLELEWQENVRDLPPKANLAPAVEAVGAQGLASAVRLMKAYHAPPAAFETLRDERQARRRELLEAARSGEPLDAYVAPEPLPEAPPEFRALVGAES